MAADAFSQAIQVKPEFVEAYNARSIVNHELGKFAEAIHDCERALKINPKYKESVFNLARSQQSLNQCDTAMHNYTKAISLDRNYFHHYLNNLSKTFKARDVIFTLLSIIPETIKKIIPSYKSLDKDVGFINVEELMCNENISISMVLLFIIHLYII